MYVIMVIACVIILKCQQDRLDVGSLGIYPIIITHVGVMSAAQIIITIYQVLLEQEGTMHISAVSRVVLHICRHKGIS